MIVKLLTEHHLEFLSLKGGCLGSSESTHVKMPHCWKSHALAHCITFAGIGYALTASGNVVNIGYYFDKRRNLMISINFVLVGVGMFCSAPLGLLIIDSYGLSSLFLILAGIYAHTCVLGMFCKPSSLERKVQEERRTRVNVQKDGNSLCHLFKFSLISCVS